MTWIAGQKAVIDRREIVTIDRVTPTGIAVVGTRKFRPDGRRIGKFARWDMIPVLHPLTPKIEAQMAAREKALAVSAALIRSLDAASDWRRSAMAAVRTGDVNPADVAKAERIAAAIEAAMEEPTND